MNDIQRIYDLLTEAQINEVRKAPLPKNVAKREGAKPKPMMTPGMEKQARLGGVAQVAAQRTRPGASPVVDPAVTAGTSQQRAGVTKGKQGKGSGSRRTPPAPLNPRGVGG